MQSFWDYVKSLLFAFLWKFYLGEIDVAEIDVVVAAGQLIIGGALVGFLVSSGEVVVKKIL